MRSHAFHRVFHDRRAAPHPSLRRTRRGLQIGVPCHFGITSESCAVICDACSTASRWRATLRVTSLIAWLIFSTAAAVCVVDFGLLGGAARHLLDGGGNLRGGLPCLRR
jgi:hypothetical protein